jgi:5-methyltetrahydrofolate--homocysteine methyltransferase
MMTQNVWINQWGKIPVLLDGATGTYLQDSGMPPGRAPEQWVLEHPDILTRLQEAYLQAGSEILYTFTFGANRIKLERHVKNSDEVSVINQKLGQLSVSLRDEWVKDHPGRKILIAGDLAPTGQFLAPAGDVSFESLVSVYREQVRGLLSAHVDLFVVETMIDLAQARAAVIAVKTECDRPVMVSMTLEKNGRTLSGQAPLECLITLASLGASAFGLNCSFGPRPLIEWLIPLLTLSPIPLLLKPNAGMPRQESGKTVFPMEAESFAKAMIPALDAGIPLIGGCCGTGPDHIAALKEIIEVSKRPSWSPSVPDCGRYICSSRQSTRLESSQFHDIPVIDASVDGDTLADLCLDEISNDPSALTLDYSSIPGERYDEVIHSLTDLQMMIQTPLIFRCNQTELLSLLLRHYHGRAGVQTRDINVGYGALLL